MATSDVGRHDFVIRAGATFKQTLTWSDELEQPFDLTGYFIALQVRQFYDSPDALLTLDTDNGGILLGDDVGTFIILIDADATGELEWRQGVYDLVLTPPGTDVVVRRLLEGTMTVSPRVTKVVMGS